MSLEDPNKKVPEPILEEGEVENLEDEFDDFDPYDDYYYENEDEDPYEYHDPEDGV